MKTTKAVRVSRMNVSEASTASCAVQKGVSALCCLQTQPCKECLRASRHVLVEGHTFLYSDVGCARTGIVHGIVLCCALFHIECVAAGRGGIPLNRIVPHQAVFGVTIGTETDGRGGLDSTYPRPDLG